MERRIAPQRRARHGGLVHRATRVMRGAMIGICGAAASIGAGCEILPADGVSIEFPPPSLVPSSKGKADLDVQKTVYVPVYSSIYGIHAKMYSHTEELVAMTSVRNVDPDNSIYILEVRYFDSHGKVIRDYIPRTYELGPMATADFVVARSDGTGGPGANFLVRWGALDPETVDPLIETVMLGGSGNTSVSLISRGRTIKTWERSPEAQSEEVR